MPVENYCIIENPNRKKERNFIEDSKKIQEIFDKLGVGLNICVYNDKNETSVQVRFSGNDDVLKFTRIMLHNDEEFTSQLDWKKKKYPLISVNKTDEIFISIPVCKWNMFSGRMISLMELK